MICFHYLPFIIVAVTQLSNSSMIYRPAGGSVDTGLQECRPYRALSGSKTGYKVASNRFMGRPLRALPHKHGTSPGRYRVTRNIVIYPRFIYSNNTAIETDKTNLWNQNWWCELSNPHHSSWSITISLLAVCIGVISDRSRALVHQKRITGAYKKVTRRYDKRLSQHVQRHRYRNRVAIIAC